ncbi:MAG TPA: TonB-dependent receptor [Cellvibrionaceae bacterium]
MNHSEKTKALTTRRPVFKKSLLAMCVVAAVHQGTVFAAEPAAETEEIVVTGMRESLNTAQDIKKSADTFVDAISAKDIGALPDKSVTEALQRVPGVTVSKYAAPVDPDHFSAEGSGVVIRGLGQTRSEFNGRDTFTANSGSGLSFQDVSPELMGAVKVYKNQTADMIEGGISGTVNLVTRKPFDKDDQVFAFNVETNYSDLAEKTAPSASALYSNVWDTDAGKFGFLANFAISNIKTRSEGVQLGRWVWVDFLDPATQIDGGLAKIDGMKPGIYMPQGGAMRYQDNDRDRKGYAASVQWESPDESLTGTLEFIRSDATAAWEERYAGVPTNNAEWDKSIAPVAGTKFKTDANGFFQSGYIGNSKSINGLNNIAPVAVQSRYQKTTNVVDDFGAHLTFKATDQLTLDFDAQHVKSTVDGFDLEIGLLGGANYFLDRTGGKPSFAFLDSADKTKTGADEASDYYWRSAMDHFEKSDGNENAFALDADYELDAGWFKSVETGVRRSEREQNTRNTAYNWGGLDVGWKGADADPSFGGYDPNPGWHGAYYKGHINTVAPDATEAVPFGGFQRGDANVPTSVWSAKLDLSKNPSLLNTFNVPQEDWNPIGSNQNKRAGENGLFLRNEIRPVDETKNSVYAKLNFGNEDLAMPISGNIGARYLSIDIETSGFVVFPKVSQDEITVKDVNNNDVKVGNPNYVFLSDEQKKYVQGDSIDVKANNKYTNVLPSFNLKMGITEDLIVRFAVSKAISLPQMGLYNNYTTIEAKVTTNPVEFKTLDDLKNATATASFSAKGGNPDLKPMEAVQEDLSLEWYFAEAGSLTGTVFYKDLKNYFISRSDVETYTSPFGATNTFSTTRPHNGDKAKVQGFELAYQQFYDFLPGPFDGLGIQANFTHVETSGIKNSGLKSDDPSGLGNSINFENLPLEGLSEDTANFTLMYQKSGFEGRLAYNYRSDYLVTSSDAVEKLPIFNKPSGSMDASFSYALNDNYKVGLQITNVLDEQTETYTYIQTLDAGNQSHTLANGTGVNVQQAIESDRSWFINDRRFALFVRGNF